MFSRLLIVFRRWRLRRLRVRTSFLEDKIDLYRRYPHNLGFEGLERVAAEERKLRRLHFAAGLIELHLRHQVAPRAQVIEDSEPAP